MIENEVIHWSDDHILNVSNFMAEPNPGIFEDSQRYSIISEKNTEINSDIYTKNTKNDSLRYIKLKSKLTFTKSKTKKCKKGFRKNKEGVCVDKLTVKKRCKNGYRRNKQGICSPK